MFADSVRLFALAREAYDRSAAKAGPRDLVESDPLIAVVFSVAALQAFVSEVAELARGSDEPKVRRLGEVLEEVEDCQGRFSLKVLLVSIILSGESYDKGKQPWQDFQLLVELRNDLVHLRPLDEERPVTRTNAGIVTLSYDVEHPRILDKLRPKNILLVGDAQESWVTQVMTPAVAQWACNTASKMVKSVADVMPPSWPSTTLDIFYRPNFPLTS